MRTKVIKIYEQGSLEVLKIEEEELKKLDSNEILIEHSFAGLNFIDINQRRGTYPLKNLPIVLGMEASGTVREIGSNVSKFNIGDKVTHCMNLGSFSQFMNLDKDRVIKLKNEVDLKIAAASTLQGLTSQYLINHSYKLKKNDTVLVHAAAGGVGQILCQWAKKIGANVIGTVSSLEKENIARQNGCHFTIDYSKDDFEKKVLEITKNNGVDVIYDSVGKDTFLKGIGCLAPKGRIVSFGVSSGPIDPININMLRSFSGSISTGGLNTYIKDANEMQMNAETFFDMIIKKDLEINIDKTFHIDKIREAQSILEKRQTTGSIVLKF
ncbi:MAG: quinone oxidoreductase family protein [Candidatus Puniceispirillales bacterium]|jgi:NADPH2:quinone reductase|tara:strand:- start:2298 stop:3272 length:975 start_codon:yes stop_codon:yes gene_type:complete